MNDRQLVRIRTVCLVAICLCSYARVDGRVWHVSQKKLAGIEAPQQATTIGEVLPSVKPGDTVTIHNGIYREKIVFEKSGLPDNPITFQAAAGASVIMTGADRISEWTEVQGQGRIYSTPWAHKFITWNRYNTHPDDDYHRLIGRCEQVFVNGYGSI